MDEKFIVNMLILNAFTFDKYQDEQYKENYHMWMYKLHELKGFSSIEETCDYFVSIGEQSTQEKVCVA